MFANKVRTRYSLGWKLGGVIVMLLSTWAIKQNIKFYLNSSPSLWKENEDTERITLTNVSARGREKEVTWQMETSQLWGDLTEFRSGDITFHIKELEKDGVKIAAQSATWQKETGIFEVSGEVKATWQNAQITCNKLIWDQKQSLIICPEGERFQLERQDGVKLVGYGLVTDPEMKRLKIMRSEGAIKSGKEEHRKK